MTFPLPLPDWLPWWVPILVLVPALLYLLVFLLMPFSVIGLKGRLDSLEARLDEIQGEIRTLVLRLPESRGGMGWAEPPPPIPPARDEDVRLSRPPIPPAPVQPPRRASPDPARRPPERDRPYGGAEEPPEAGWQEDADPEQEASQRRRPVIRPSRPGRTEPRLDWPR